MAHRIDPDGRDSALRHLGADPEQNAVFVGAATVAENRHGPSGWRLDTRGKEEVEEDLVSLLNRRCARASTNLWDELTRVDLVVRRCVLAKSNRAHGARHNAERRHRDRDGRELGRVTTNLCVERDGGDGG